MICSRYSTVGRMEDCYSEGRGFKPVSGKLPFVDMKISNQHHAACSRAFLATLICLCSCVCLGYENANPSYLSNA